MFVVNVSKIQIGIPSLLHNQIDKTKISIVIEYYIHKEYLTRNSYFA